MKRVDWMEIQDNNDQIESEERFRSLFSNMQEGFAYCKMLYDGRNHPVDFVYLEVNDAFERLTGLKDAAGKKVTEVIPGIMESSRELFEIYGRVASTGKPEKFVTHFKPLDLWLAISVYSTKKGTFAAVFDNITERKRAEKILKENEERLRILFELAPDAYYISTLNGVFVDGNRAAENLIGYKREELIGRNFLALKILSPDQTRKAALLLVKNLAKKSTGPDEFVLNRKDGSRITAEISTHPVRIHDKSLVLGIARDITYRKLADLKLRESEEKFRNYIERAPDGVFVADAAGRFIEANESACRITGYSREEIERMSVSDLLAEESLKEGMDHFTRMLDTGAAVSDLWHRKKDGSRCCLTVHAVRLSETRILGFCKDITERRQAEDKLKSLLREKDLLVKEVHHRVKNNFMVVSSLLGLQAQQIEDESAQKMFMESRDRIRSMSLIHERLYQSRDFTHIELSEYIRTLADDIFRSYATNKSKVLLTVEADDIAIEVDRAIPCGLVLNELITNALKYGFPPGWKGDARIEVTLRRIAGNGIQLAVKDNGAGLPADFDISKTESLGLKILQILVEDQLAGKLNVARGGGTQISVQFSVDNKNVTGER